MGLIDDSLAMMMSGGAIELIPRVQWDALSKEQKMTHGLVAVQDSTVGYTQGILVNGANYSDYATPPVLIEPLSRNAATLGSLSYTFHEDGKYQIIGTLFQGGTFYKNTAGFTLNNEPIDHTYSCPDPAPGNSAGVNLFVAEVIAANGDTISFTNTTAYESTGMNMFVVQNAIIDDIEVYQARYNGESSFYIDIDGYYLQVSRTSYYAGNNTFEYHQIGNTKENSVACDSSYWYGANYVITLQNYDNR